MMHACYPRTWETEAGGLLRVQDQPELHNKTISKMKKKKKIQDMKWYTGHWSFGNEEQKNKVSQHNPVIPAT